MFSSLVSVSCMRISSTVSMPRGALKYTMPLRAPEMPMTPVYSYAPGFPSVTR